MSFDQHREIARSATEAAKGLGFDHLIVKAQTVRTFAVRIAQSAVCRENVALTETIFRVAGMWRGRESLLSTQARDAQELLTKIKELRQSIELQAEDKEAVLPDSPRGRFSWQPGRAEFDQLYAPETVYPAIAAHAARVRGLGLRMTGYVEARETRAHAYSTTGFELATHDHGVTVSISVDDQKTGAVGAAARASVHAEPEALHRLIGDATEEALTTCRTSNEPAELAPGDYTVVLHPLAVVMRRPPPAR
jgi:predicted Zn-dependent protease